MINRVRDISHHNLIKDYAAFRANAGDVQIKVTESTAYIDPAAPTHYHYTNGMRRAPYHFARPVNLPSQISNFLVTKDALGKWERPDMLDCEFPGITGAFIAALVAEYRRQSGIRKVQVYIGLHDILTSCPPSGWWDSDIYIQVSRYRKIGPPTADNWANHLGFDHPGLSTYQWDNETPFYPGGALGDISYDRSPVLFGGGNVMSGEADKLISDMNIKLARIKTDTDAGRLDIAQTKYVINKDNYDVLIDAFGAAQRVEPKVDSLLKLLMGIVADIAAIKAAQTGQPTTFVIEPSTFTLKPE